MSTTSEVKTAICPHFGVCGGCSKQNLDYTEQLSLKEKFVQRYLKDLSIRKFHSILPSPDIYFYRNKMEFSFGDQRDLKILSDVAHGIRSDEPAESTHFPAHLGLHPKGRFALVTPTPECQLLSEESRIICRVVEEWANANKVSVYVRKSGEGDLRHLVIREGKNTGERLVNLVSKSTTPHIEDLAERLKNSGAVITTFISTAYDGLSDVAGGDDQTVYWGRGFIQEKLSGVFFRVNPISFMQTNTHAAEMMIDVLKGWVYEGKTLLDLYCGAGTIGLSLADRFNEVIGLEINHAAVEDAHSNALSNMVKNIRFLEGKAEDMAAQLPLGDQTSDLAILVDPPRAGLHPKLVKTLLEWRAPNFFYVSCNPETLARDLRAFSERYDILDVQPMDFFPHTDHVETAVRLSLK